MVKCIGINDQAKSELLVSYAIIISDEIFPYTVSQGHIFVLGDHRTHAIDSRMRDLGAIDQNQIVGKVVLRVYPVIRFSVL